MRSADRHRRGRLFCPTFLAEQKSGSAAGTNTRLLPTAVSAATLHPPGRRSNGALLLCSRMHATATVAARNVNGNDPLPTRVTLRYTRCASTQGERGKRTAARHGNGNGNCRYAERQRQRQRSLRGTSRTTATVAARATATSLRVAGQCRAAHRHVETLTFQRIAPTRAALCDARQSPRRRP